MGRYRESSGNITEPGVFCGMGLNLRFSTLSIAKAGSGCQSQCQEALEAALEETVAQTRQVLQFATR